MEKQLQDKLNAINTVISLIDNLEFKKTLFELSLSLIKETIKETNKSNVYLEYTEERIIKEPTITGSRLKISTVQDDFKEWYSIHYGKTTPEILKLFKEFLVTKFGKYPQNGWAHISLSEEEI
jgi:hypothetical protein